MFGIMQRLASLEAADVRDCKIGDIGVARGQHGARRGNLSILYADESFRDMESKHQQCRWVGL
jgi:hypothetical protein